MTQAVLVIASKESESFTIIPNIIDGLVNSLLGFKEDMKRFLEAHELNEPL